MKSEFSLIFLISAVASAADVSDQCQQGMEDIFSLGGDSDVGLARDALDNFFFENCALGDDGNVVCEVESDAKPYTRTEMSYESLVDDENYKGFAAACRDMGEGYAFCTVDTVYQNETHSTTRIGEPVCVPPSCSIDETDLAEVISSQQHHDDNCEGQENKCEVPKPTSISFNCGDADRQAETSTSACGEASKTTTEDLEEYKNSLELSVLLFCLAAFAGATDDQLPCKVSMDPIISSVTGNFDEIVDQTVYKEYESACNAVEEAQFCTISYTLELGYDLVIGSGDITMDMSHSPGCFPLGCSKEDMTSYVPALADKKIVDAMFEKSGASRRRLSASRTAIGEFQRKVLTRRLQLGFTDEATPGDGLDFFLGGDDTMPDGTDLDSVFGGDSGLPDEANMEVPSLKDLCIISAQGKVIDSESVFWCTFQVDKMQCNGEVLVEAGTTESANGEGDMVVDAGETEEGETEDNAATIYIEAEEDDENHVGTGDNVEVDVVGGEQNGEVETIIDVDSEVQRSSSSGAPILAAKLLFSTVAVLYSFVGM